MIGQCHTRSEEVGLSRTVPRQSNTSGLPLVHPEHKQPSNRVTAYKHQTAPQLPLAKPEVDEAGERNSDKGVSGSGWRRRVGLGGRHWSIGPRPSLRTINVVMRAGTCPSFACCLLVDGVWGHWPPQGALPSRAKSWRPRACAALAEGNIEPQPSPPRLGRV